MKITKKQLKRIVREAMDYDPLGDAGVPHVGVVEGVAKVK